MNLVASIQAALEEIIFRLTRSLAHETSIPNLAMAEVSCIMRA
jgi:predicted NodU family carbamoyl transferase